MSSNSAFHGPGLSRIREELSLSPGDIWVHFGPVGGLKTLFAINMAYERALLTSSNVLYTSTQLTDRACRHRFATRHSVTLGGAVPRHVLSEWDRENLYEDLLRTKMGSCHFRRSLPLNLDEFAKDGVKIDHVIVDEVMPEERQASMDRLRRNAVEHNVSVFVLCQMNRHVHELLQSNQRFARNLLGLWSTSVSVVTAMRVGSPGHTTDAQLIVIKNKERDDLRATPLCAMPAYDFLGEVV